MIIWINGAFGAGKTQAAFELVRRNPGLVLSDPEEPGFGLNRMVPSDLRGDFQDFPAWRDGVRQALARIAESGRDVVAPMTLIEYHDEVIGGLRQDGHDVRHVILDASPEVLRRRLQGRAAALLGRQETWAIAQIDRCVQGLAELPGASHVDTDSLTLDEVAEAVAAAVGLKFPIPRASKPARAWHTMRAKLAVLR